MRGPVGHPTLNPDRAERVRVALRQLYKERFDENGTALGRAINRSQAAVSQLLTGKNAASYETAERVAALMGVSTAELLGDEGPSSIPRPRPHLSAAIEYVSVQGSASAATIRDVSAAARYLPDLDVPTWIMLLSRVESASQPEGPPPEVREAKPKKGARRSS